MLATVHALLLIAALLACPFRCLGIAAAGGAPADVTDKETAAPVAHSCACCSHACVPAAGEAAESLPQPPVPGEPTVPGDQYPDEPCPDEPCRCNCLCQGAVLTDDTAVQDLLVSVTGLLTTDLLPASLIEPPHRLFGGIAEPPPHPAIAAGRPLRFWLHSLQV